MLNELEIGDYTLEQKQTIFLHTCIALFCVPLYMLGPNLIAYLLTPYLAYMIFQGRSEFYIPLMIHTFYGSQQRTIMLTCCFIYCIFHVAQLARYGVRWLFLLYLLLSPFFVWFTYARFQYQGWGGMFEGWGCYMTFAAFFWGLLTGGGVRKSLFKYMLAICAGLSIILNLTFVQPTMLGGWGVSYCLVLGGWLFLKGRKNNTERFAFFACLLLYGLAFLSFLRLTGRSVTFTLLGSAGAGILFLMAFKFFNRQRRLFQLILHPIVVFGLSINFTFTTIDKWMNKRQELVDTSIAYEDIKVHDVNSFMERWNRKSVGDRGILWAATWNTIKRQFAYSPFYASPDFNSGEVDLTLSSGQTVVHEVDLSAHNAFLELLRNYGLYGGGGMYLMYVLVVWVVWKRMPFMKFWSSEYAPLLATCFGHIYVGGQGGQYTILPVCSFVIFGLLGYCFRASFYDHRIFIDRRLALRAPQPEGWMVG